MTTKRYPVLIILAMSLLAACAPSTPTPQPFARYTAQDALNALVAAGLSVDNPTRDMLIGRGAPGGFTDRYTFEIDVRNIAPNGGQILVFADRGAFQEWQSHIEQQRASAATRRDWINVFYKDNLLLQLNADLTNDEARAYGDALAALP